MLGVGGSKATFLGDLRLVWTRSTLLVCSIVQRERVGGCFSEKMDGFSSFSSFQVKLTVVGRVLSAIVVVEDSTGFRIAIEGVDEEKTVIFGGFSSFFCFKGAGDCSMIGWVGGPILRSWDVEIGCVEPISGGFGAEEGAGGENGCGDVAVTCAGSLF